MNEQYVDLNLVELICSNIPDHTWSDVKEQLVDAFVSAMPSNVLEQLTGSRLGDDRALEILDEYYTPQERNKDLIIDALQILGPEQTTYMLDSLQLDKRSNQTLTKELNND